MMFTFKAPPSCRACRVPRQAVPAYPGRLPHVQSSPGDGIRGGQLEALWRVDIVGVAASAAILYGAAGLCSSPAQAIPVPNFSDLVTPSDDRSKYVMLERERVEKLVMREFAEGLAELTDQELTDLLEDVVRSRRTSSASWLWSRVGRQTSQRPAGTGMATAERQAPDPPKPTAESESRAVPTKPTAESETRAVLTKPIIESEVRAVAPKPTAEPEERAAAVLASSTVEKGGSGVKAQLGTCNGPRVFPHAQDGSVAGPSDCEPRDLTPAISSATSLKTPVSNSSAAPLEGDISVGDDGEDQDFTRQLFLQLLSPPSPTGADVGVGPGTPQPGERRGKAETLSDTEEGTNADAQAGSGIEGAVTSLTSRLREFTPSLGSWAGQNREGQQSDPSAPTPPIWSLSLPTIRFPALQAGAGLATTLSDRFQGLVTTLGSNDAMETAEVVLVPVGLVALGTAGAVAISALVDPSSEAAETLTPPGLQPATSELQPEGRSTEERVKSGGNATSTTGGQLPVEVPAVSAVSHGGPAQVLDAPARAVLQQLADMKDRLDGLMRNWQDSSAATDKNGTLQALDPSDGTASEATPAMQAVRNLPSSSRDYSPVVGAAGAKDPRLQRLMDNGPSVQLQVPSPTETVTTAFQSGVVEVSTSLREEHKRNDEPAALGSGPILWQRAEDPGDNTRQRQGERSLRTSPAAQRENFSSRGSAASLPSTAPAAKNAAGSIAGRGAYSSLPDPWTGAGGSNSSTTRAQPQGSDSVDRVLGASQFPGDGGYSAGAQDLSPWDLPR